VAVDDAWQWVQVSRIVSMCALDVNHVDDDARPKRGMVLCVYVHAAGCCLIGGGGEDGEGWERAGWPIKRRGDTQLANDAARRQHALAALRDAAGVAAARRRRRGRPASATDNAAAGGVRRQRARCVERATG